MELRELRKSKNLRLVDVANKLNVNAAAVSNWERGFNGITSKYIKPLARMYGVPAAEIKAISDANRARSKEGT